MRLNIVYFLARILKKFPRRMLLHLSSTFPSQFALVYVVRVKYSTFGYNSPKSKVPFKYLNIHLKNCTCVSLGAT
jgi:hypothetical protein